MNGNVDIQSVYDMLPFIPVQKETYKAMCFQNEQLRKAERKYIVGRIRDSEVCQYT